MTISKIEIAAFAGLKNYTLDFENGFNVIHGENEQGKTTVMAFIKMMFYGSGRSGKTLAKNMRQKYLPWSGEPAGGRIYFEQNGHRYCLERIFKKSDSTDRVTLRDLDLGKEETVGSDIGKSIFGLSEAAFERSVFIGQTGILENDETANSELNARLSNLTTTGDESISYQEIQSRLEAARYALTTKQKVGEYDKGVKRLSELKEKLAAADSTARRCAEMEAERNRLTASAVTVEKEYRQLKELTDRENDIRQAEKLERFLKTKADLEAFNNGLLLSDGKLADTVFLSKINFCLAKFDKEQQQVTDRQTAVDDLQKDIAYREKAKTSLTPEGIEQMQNEKTRLEESRLTAEQEHTAAVNELETAEQQKAQGSAPKKAFHPLLLALGAVFIAVGIALFFMKLAVPGIAVGAVGLIGIILSFILRPTDTAAQLKIEQDIVRKREKVADTKTALGELQEEINHITAEIDRAESVLHSDESALNQRRKDLSEAELRLKEAVFSRDTSLSELCLQFGLYRETDSFEEIKNLLPELQQKIEQQKELKMQLKYMSDDLGGISYEAAAERLEKSKTATVWADTDFADAKKRLDELTELKSAMATKYATLESELKNELKYAVMPDVIEQEIAELEERLKHQKQFIDAVTIAEKVLENSYAEVRRGYGSALESKTQEIFAQLTGGRYQNVRVSKSMDVDAESTDAFGTHNVAYFSNGTIDQAYLSLRLAVAEGMDGDERLPLFLDDVLCQYDDKRTALALQYLKDYAANTQIILFTCHKSVCEEANSNGVAVKELR